MDLGRPDAIGAYITSGSAGSTGTVAVTEIEGVPFATLDALRRHQPYRRWLLIFDNADQPEAITDLISSGSGSVLISSRNRRWDLLPDRGPVDVFTREESIDFLIY